MTTITLTLNPRDRLTLSTTIERLINLLDALEPDPDAETTATERHGMGFQGSAPDDSEDTHDAEWDQAEIGIADGDGLAEQWPRYGHGSCGFVV